MIEAVSLSRSFGTVRAVREVSFRVERGEAVGFLGPNGAGKTTTFRMLTGSLGPSSGQVLIDGQELTTQPVAAKRKFGYMPENPPLYPEMTVTEYLAYRAELKGLSTKSARREAIDRWAKATAIGDVLGTRIGHLSKGYRQRVGLSDALLTDPPALLLDEPTAGLDPNQVLDVRRLIRRLARTKAILISTHVLSEVEATCARAVVLHEGRVVASGSLDELGSVRRRRRVRLLLGRLSVPPKELFREETDVVVEDAEGDEVQILVGVAKDETPHRVLARTTRRAHEAGADVLEASIDHAPLDEVFSRLTRSAREIQP